jgi:hypothetical protein
VDELFEDDDDDDQSDEDEDSDSNEPSNTLIVNAVPPVDPKFATSTELAPKLTSRQVTSRTMMKLS